MELPDAVRIEGLDGPLKQSDYAVEVLSGSLPFFNKMLHKLYRQIVERDEHLD